MTTAKTKENMKKMKKKRKKEEEKEKKKNEKGKKSKKIKKKKEKGTKNVSAYVNKNPCTISQAFGESTPFRTAVQPQSLTSAPASVSWPTAYLAYHSGLTLIVKDREPRPQRRVGLS